LLVVSVITLLGFLAQRSGGDRAVGAFDRLFSLVPLVNVVYTGVRQVSDAVAGEDTGFVIVPHSPNPTAGRLLTPSSA
jgi:uncharacterized membrane protein